MNHKILKFFLLVCSLVSLESSGQKKSEKEDSEPNIIIILTDDQGIGDVGFMDNPYIKTPNLDRLAANGVRFTNFHVDPVCAPTRAALMTGKYPQKTGVYDTYNGGAIMATEEITMAEILRDHGYRTSIFGKWHLGDNHPYRPQDQGFSVSLVHKGGGIGQPGDVHNYAAGDSAYFNPILYKNGEKIKSRGYCSDVFTEGAIDFIKGQGDNPFFLYLSFNAPHTPLQVPQEYYDLYKDISLEEYKEEFKGKDRDIREMTEKDLDDARKVYGMVTNIDTNIGRIMEVLESEKITDNTIIVFMSDNGPQQKRYKLGYRGRKGSVYEGGVRVPFLIYGPKKNISMGREIDLLAAHIDLLPTILDFCEIKVDLDHNIDGNSLASLIKNGTSEAPLLKRTIFREWGRGYPVPYRNMSVRKGKYKLVTQGDYRASWNNFELYNLTTDPAEKNNLIEKEKKMAIGMKAELDAWIGEIYSHPNNRRIHHINIGSSAENPVLLSRNDAKGPEPPWDQHQISGYWDVKVVEKGTFDFNFHFFEDLEELGHMSLKMYPYHFAILNNDASAAPLKMKNVELAKGTYKLEPFYSYKGKSIFPFYVEVVKKND